MGNAAILGSDHYRHMGRLNTDPAVFRPPFAGGGCLKYRHAISVSAGLGVGVRSESYGRSCESPGVCV